MTRSTNYFGSMNRCSHRLGEATFIAKHLRGQQCLQSYPCETARNNRHYCHTVYQPDARAADGVLSLVKHDWCCNDLQRNIGANRVVKMVDNLFSDFLSDCGFNSHIGPSPGTWPHTVNPTPPNGPCVVTSGTHGQQTCSDRVFHRLKRDNAHQN